MAFFAESESKRGAASAALRDPVRADWRLALILVSSLVLCWPPDSAQAQDISRADVGKWLETRPAVPPNFKAGDVLSAADLDRLRPFVPPGYLEQLSFPSFKMKIVAVRSHEPRQDYVNCTERYQPQVRLGPDGTLTNHICGQPFSNASLNPSDPPSGLKAAWNFELRWQNFGEFDASTVYVPMYFGGTHDLTSDSALQIPPEQWLSGINLQTKLPPNIGPYVQGGGTVRRTFSSSYQRLYFTHLAQAADKGGVLDVPNAKAFFWKEFSGFITPYDLRGQVFITYRYSDFHKADDSWIYDPIARRVRRFSAEEKSDSFMGTDETLNDFYSFSGHVLDWNWKFLGWRDLVSVMDSAHTDTHTYGPNGNIPDDVWSLRRFAVVERTPKNPANPYGDVIMFWDAENWTPWLELAFDHHAKLWRVLVYVSSWSEDLQPWSDINRGTHVTIVQGGQTIDVQNHRSTLFLTFGRGSPDVNMERANKLFDPSNLEQVHR
jgi:hypothetical protein